MVVPTPELDDAVLLSMVRCALHTCLPGTPIDESDDDVAGHLIDPVSDCMIDPVAGTGRPAEFGLAAVEACGRAAWVWRGVDQELCALLCQSRRRRRRS